jgi:hypothetical protein
MIKRICQFHAWSSYGGWPPLSHNEITKLWIWHVLVEWRCQVLRNSCLTHYTCVASMLPTHCIIIWWFCIIITNESFQMVNVCGSLVWCVLPHIIRNTYIRNTEFIILCNSSFAERWGPLAHWVSDAYPGPSASLP